MSGDQECIEGEQHTSCEDACRGKDLRPFRYVATAIKTTKVKLCRDDINNKSTQNILHEKNVVAGYTPFCKSRMHFDREEAA